jgi:hypothetical protein
MRKKLTVDLKDILDKFHGFEESLGPAELQVLKDADILLKGTIPIDEPGRLAYLSRSAQMLSSLNNLLSRISFVHGQYSLEKNVYWGHLIKEQEYEGRDKWVVALSEDNQLADMERLTTALDVTKSHVNNLHWIIKTICGRL